MVLAKGGADAKIQIWKVFGVLLAWKDASQSVGRMGAGDVKVGV